MNYSQCAAIYRVHVDLETTARSFQPLFTHLTSALHKSIYNLTFPQLGSVFTAHKFPPPPNAHIIQHKVLHFWNATYVNLTFKHIEQTHTSPLLAYNEAQCPQYTVILHSVALPTSESTSKCSCFYMNINQHVTQRNVLDWMSYMLNLVHDWESKTLTLLRRAVPLNDI